MVSLSPTWTPTVRKRIAQWPKIPLFYILWDPDKLQVSPFLEIHLRRILCHYVSHLFKPAYHPSALNPWSLLFKVPKGHVNMRISHSGSKDQYRGIPETMVARIPLFRWPLGPVNPRSSAQSPRRIQNMEPLILDLDGVDYRTLRWIHVLDPPSALFFVQSPWPLRTPATRRSLARAARTRALSWPRPPSASRPRLSEIQRTWTPKVCKTIAFWATF